MFAGKTSPKHGSSPQIKGKPSHKEKGVFDIYGKVYPLSKERNAVDNYELTHQDARQIIAKGLARGKPFLWDHKADQVVGSIQDVWIEQDGWLHARGTVRVGGPIQSLKQISSMGLSVGFTLSMDPDPNRKNHCTGKVFNEISLTPDPFFEKSKIYRCFGNTPPEETILNNIDSGSCSLDDNSESVFQISAAAAAADCHRGDNPNPSVFVSSRQVNSPRSSLFGPFVTSRNTTTTPTPITTSTHPQHLFEKKEPSLFTLPSSVNHHKDNIFIMSTDTPTPPSTNAPSATPSTSGNASSGTSAPSPSLNNGGSSGDKPSSSSTTTTTANNSGQSPPPPPQEEEKFTIPTPDELREIVSKNSPEDILGSLESHPQKIELQAAIIKTLLSNNHPQQPSGAGESSPQQLSGNGGSAEADAKVRQLEERLAQYERENQERINKEISSNMESIKPAASLCEELGLNPEFSNELPQMLSSPEAEPVRKAFLLMSSEIQKLKQTIASSAATSPPQSLPMHSLFKRSSSVVPQQNLFGGNHPLGSSTTTSTPQALIQQFNKSGGGGMSSSKRSRPDDVFGSNAPDPKSRKSAYPHSGNPMGHYIPLGRK